MPRYAQHPRTVRFAEFFAGIGLIREAVAPLGWECVFANDISPVKAEHYRIRHGNNGFLEEDIRNLTAGDLPAGIDAVTASFPCVDISAAGKRAGLAGSESGTVWPFLDLLDGLRRRVDPPGFLLIENVLGLLTSNGGQDLAELCRRVAGIGYNLDMVVVDAKWFVPQSRPRLFLLGVIPDEQPRRGAGWMVSSLRPAAVRRFEEKHPDIPFIDLPMPEPPVRAEQDLESAAEPQGYDAGTWWSETSVAEAVAGMSEKNRVRVGSLIADRGVGSMYRRTRAGRVRGEVRYGGPAGCLLAANGGSSTQFLLDGRSGVLRVRPMSGAEYARLQGSESGVEGMSERTARMCYGDGVCVPAVRWLATYAFG